jgi:hypothetical protein
MTTLTKLDLAAQMRHLYRARETPELVDVPPMPFLMTDGHGAPGAVGFREAIQALYGVSYTLKFRVRKEVGVDFKVMPLEGLWWIPEARVWDFDDKSDWDWILMIVQPEVVTETIVREAIADVVAKKDVPGIDRLRFETFAEGAAAQILHVGPWSAERPTLETLHTFVRDRELLPVGKHHEIYLSDPGRTTPERLRTILRQPVAPRG